jgi:hypothetical protein
VAALIQYFTCSLISIRSKDDGPADMQAFFERQRPLIFTAFLALAAINMFQNWWDRALIPAPLNWFDVDLTIAVLLIAYAIAGFARAAWLQWVAAVVTTAEAVYWLVKYAF